MPDRQDDPDSVHSHHQLPFAMMPGINHNEIGVPFRDGPRSVPERYSRIKTALVCGAALGATIVLIAILAR